MSIWGTYKLHMGSADIHGKVTFNVDSIALGMIFLFFHLYFWVWFRMWNDSVGFFVCDVSAIGLFISLCVNVVSAWLSFIFFFVSWKYCNGIQSKCKGSYCIYIHTTAAWWAKQQFIFLTQEKYLSTWLCPCAIRSQCLAHLEPWCFATPQGTFYTSSFAHGRSLSYVKFWVQKRTNDLYLLIY